MLDVSTSITVRLNPVASLAVRALVWAAGACLRLACWIAGCGVTISYSVSE